MSKPSLKITLLFFIAALISCQNSRSPCQGEECKYNVQVPNAQPTDISQVISLVDKEVRRVYWYYLRKAVVLYQTNIDTPSKYLHFFIYRNGVGTFLCIADWSKKSQQSSNILTFVRLGNGFAQDVETLYSPVKIEPVFISLRLPPGEFLIEVDENGSFRVNGKLINLDATHTYLLTQEQISARVHLIDQHIRSNYWYFLKDAQLLVAENIQTTERLWVVLTYLNVVGTFLVIASSDANSQVFVNTFVRLGAGASGATQLQPIKIEPSVFTLTNQ